MCYNIFILGGVNMPATVTHTIFTKDVYDILTPEIRGYLDIDSFIICYLFFQERKSENLLVFFIVLSHKNYS